jgi:LysM repeat protein
MKLAVLAAMAIGLPVAHAQEANDQISYRVRPGDSLELIAAEVYGDRNKAPLIAMENKLTRPRPLRPGERLRLPINREVTTSPGDTLQSLAGNYLGNTRRAPLLAEFNGMSIDDSLPAGAPITIPISVVHTAVATEPLTEIARMYFGDAKQAEMLRRYNLLEKRTLERNESVTVPLYQIHVAAARLPSLDPASKARRDRRRDAIARIARALPAARQAWKIGDYAGVQAALGELEPDLDFLDAGDAADAGVLLGAAQVAFDHDAQALALFKHVIERQPAYAMRRYDASPRIIAVWQRAGGQAQ